jgi:hypothetical protein
MVTLPLGANPAPRQLVNPASNVLLTHFRRRTAHEPYEVVHRPRVDTLCIARISGEGKILNQPSIRCVKHVFRARLRRFIVWQYDGDGNEVVGASEGVEGQRADGEGFRAGT